MAVLLGGARCRAIATPRKESGRAHCSATLTTTKLKDTRANPSLLHLIRPHQTKTAAHALNSRDRLSH